MDIHFIYRNPPIKAPLFVFAMLSQIAHQRVNGHMCSIIEFRLEPTSPKTRDIRLYSTLHHTDQAEDIWYNCRRAFRFEFCDLRSAIGHWAKLYLVPSKWKKKKYSTVQYLVQNSAGRERASELEADTQCGRISWPDRDNTEPEHVTSKSVQKEQEQMPQIEF